ncbi:MAG TPA: TatD family hydrolase [Thermoanaerobaculia bacterium]|nr:TatD family hydrolase [Thermoanaerobaculia bacterium]
MPFEYADSHGHLTMVFDGGEMKGAPRAPRPDEVKLLVTRAIDAGVTRILVPSTDLEDQRRAVDTAERFDGVYAAVGFHPHEAKEFDEDRDLPLFEELCASKKVVAVGEIGLDYHYDHSPRDVQKRVVAAQLRFARSRNLPVLLHNRLSEADLLPILEAEYPGTPEAPRGVFHSFCADVATGERALALGYLVSFSGMLTFKTADNVREAAAALPLGSTLLETDAPYLAPAPLRGKPNESSYLPRTAARLAEVKGVSVEEIARATTENFMRLFRVS